MALLDQNTPTASGKSPRAYIDPYKIVDPIGDMRDITPPVEIREGDDAIKDFENQQRGERKNQRDQSQVRLHTHDGTNSQQIELRALRGLFQVTDTVPTSKPVSVVDQIVIYTNGATYRLYWYDWVNDAWRYATGT